MSPAKQTPDPDPKGDPGVTIRLQGSTLTKLAVPVVAALVGLVGGRLGFPTPGNPLDGSSTHGGQELKLGGPRTAADRAWCDEIVARATWHARLDAANKVCSSIPDERTKRLIFECSTIFGTLAEPSGGGGGPFGAPNAPHPKGGQSGP
jgi:hypothetical protein